MCMNGDGANAASSTGPTGCFVLIPGKLCQTDTPDHTERAKSPPSRPANHHLRRGLQGSLQNRPLPLTTSAPKARNRSWRLNMFERIR